jgi:hypothetical protein
LVIHRKTSSVEKKRIPVAEWMVWHQKLYKEQTEKKKIKKEEEGKEGEEEEEEERPFLPSLLFLRTLTASLIDRAARCR